MIYEQSDEDLEKIKNASYMKDLLTTPGWRLIDSGIKDELSSLKVKRDSSDDPNIIMSCIRQEDGIMFVKEVIQEYITLGDEAVKNSA